MLVHVWSWPQFWLAALLGSVFWYAGLLWVYRRKGNGDWFRGGGKGNEKAPEPLPHRWEEEFDDSEDDLMGQKQQAEGDLLLTQEEFSFKPLDRSVPEPEFDDPDNALLQGDVFDLMENLKPVIASAGLDKAAFIALVNEQVREFPRLIKSVLLFTVYQLVCEQVADAGHFAFKLRPGELEADLLGD